VNIEDPIIDNERSYPINNGCKDEKAFIPHRKNTINKVL
jgi:hypothetical protein